MGTDGVSNCYSGRYVYRGSLAKAFSCSVIYSVLQHCSYKYTSSPNTYCMQITIWQIDVDRVMREKEEMRKRPVQ